VVSHEINGWHDDGQGQRASADLHLVQQLSRPIVQLVLKAPKLAHV
jgi:hypothetical protein